MYVLNAIAPQLQRLMHASIMQCTQHCTLIDQPCSTECMASWLQLKLKLTPIKSNPTWCAPLTMNAWLTAFFFLLTCCISTKKKLGMACNCCEDLCVVRNHSLQNLRSTRILGAVTLIDGHYVASEWRSCWRYASCMVLPLAIVQWYAFHIIGL